MEWTAQRLRETFLRFFKERGHAIIPSASLIPENDPSVLFTTAGMHPLVPYLMGQVHPAGKRLANVQKCIRTGDIDEVGDAVHLTFFEMLGNWSLGDPDAPDKIGTGYFKKDAIRWSWELLTGKEWFGLDPQRIAVTVFAGDADAPRDNESAALWKSCGIPERHIAFLGKDENWWPAGGKHPGPQGSDTEIFYWISDDPPPVEFDPKDGRWVEIWNDVFMEFNRVAEGVPTPSPDAPDASVGTSPVGTGHSPSSPSGTLSRCSGLRRDLALLEEGEKKEGSQYEPLAQKNVDTGMGLERMLCVLTGAKTVYETDLFEPILRSIEGLITAHPPTPPHPEGGGERKEDFLPLHLGGGARGGGVYDVDERHRRIIADHLRAATFILGDPFGISPSNVDQGYVLRKLIRRAVRAGRGIGITKSPWTPDVAEVVIAHYRSAYPELEQHRSRILFELREEEERFNETLDRGLKRIEALGEHVSGTDAFDLYQSYGFPPELTAEILTERGTTFDREEFDAAMKKHQEQSRAAMGQRFAGGLADHSDQSIRYHTATHLLHAALREVLGDHVAQKGSNITPGRLRFDFSHPQKLTPDELVRVNAIVQEKIDADLSVHYELVPIEEAKAVGAIGLFEDKYAQLGAKVKMYVVEGPKKGCVSREICGGPHVVRTGMIGKFRIVKEEAISQGVRRIKAVVDPPNGGVEIAVSDVT
ncbi:MAG: alanine--tRNA ligase-related protein [Candidatus Uhrbacteria bacterium]